MRTLITGGAGFIGSHLCELLISRDDDVVCVDNLITGSTDNIKSLLSNKGFKFINHDVSQNLNVKGNIDYVLHFASPASPVDYLRLPIETLAVGSSGTLNALELAKQKEARFLFASTSEVYGDPLKSPQTEDYWGNVNPVGPRSVYDESKRFSEALVMAYHRRFNLDTRIIRIFNTYGPRMRPNDGRAIPNFIMQSLNGEPITVFGDGSQTRSFCYITDLIEGITRLMESSINEPINLGNPDELTILQLARKIIDMTNSKSTIVFKPLPENDPKLRRPDISKAKRILAWEPRTDLDKGLQQTIEWFKDYKVVMSRG
jgi:dTDP-glucose 4,6-dehydratase